MDYYFFARAAVGAGHRACPKGLGKNKSYILLVFLSVFFVAT